LDRAAVS